jgi:tetratricopeptide (TPR) repeat protein
MDHPNIARVFDGGATAFGMRAGRPYFVMELVRGLPITQYCDETKMSTRGRLELFIQVCRAVQHAHQKGIIHRDLKPSNILVTEQDGRPVPKVIDFGIAKATESRLTDKTLFTGFQQWLGTPAYMSPEQAGLASLDIDTRSDVYSLGVVLYQLLTGSTPFDTQVLLECGLEAVLRTIREVDPPKPSTRLKQERLIQKGSAPKSEIGNRTSEIDPDLDWIVMKCLEKDRNRRYETANGLAADLERCLRDEPVQARPPSTGYRLRKFVRKHRGPVAAAAGFVVLLVGATALSVGLAMWANSERNRAETARQAETAQRLATEEERNRAKDAEVEARTVLQFFEDKVLAAARRKGERGGLGKDVTLQAAVDAAANEIQSSFTNRQFVEASIRNVLGATYRDLGEYAKAVEQFERALALQRARAAPDAYNTLLAMNNLADSYQDAGRNEEALTLLEQTVELCKKTLGLDHAKTLLSINNLAESYKSAGRLTNAVLLFEDNLTRQQALLGAQHRDTLITVNNLADAYDRLGRLDDGVRMYEKLVEITKSKLGLDDLLTIHAMNNLAHDYRATGRPGKAVPLLEQAMGLATTNFGPDHAETLIILNNLARAYQGDGRWKDAVALFERAVEGCKVKLGPLHATTIKLRRNQAAACVVSGDLATAEALWRELLEDQEKFLAPDSLALADNRFQLANCLLWLGNYGEAESLLRKCQQVFDHEQRGRSSTFRVRGLLWWALLGQKKYAEAEPLLVQAHEGLRQRRADPASEPATSFLNETVERLVQLYEAWGKPDQAALWRENQWASATRTRP